VLADVAGALGNDTKEIHFAGFDAPVAFGQLVVWDASEVLKLHKPVIAQVLSGRRPDWFINLVSIGEGHSHLVTDRAPVQKWLASLLDIEFDGDTATADRLWLRKEVIKAAQDA